MPDLDEFLKRELRRTIAPVDVNDVSSKIDVRRSRRERLRKVRAVGLTMVVLAGTIGGVAMLSRAFREPGSGVGVAPPVRNGVIVYSEVRNAGQHLWVVNPDGSDARMLTVDEGGSDSDPSISPDGRTVAFVRTDEEGSSIFTIGLDGTNLTQLTGSPAFDPAWSPDGSKIAFAGGAFGPYGIWTMDPDGSDPKLIVGTDEIEVAHPTWAADGAAIAFAGGQDEPWDLYSVPLDASSSIDMSELTNTPDAGEAWPSLSPNGARIVFTRDGALWLRDMGSGEESQLTTSTEVQPDSNPSWSPDGSQIAFERASDASADIYTIRADGSALTLVIRNATGPAWQPIRSNEPVPTPTASPTSSADPDDKIGLGFPVCNVQQLGGDAEGDGAPDFDGDGRVDTAYLATKESDVGGCPQADTATNILGIDLTGDGQIDVESGPIGCQLDCRPFMALDLDDDGDEELLVQQLGGAILGLVPYGIIDVDGTPALSALVVVPPGHPDNGFAPGEPATFYAGGDEGFSASVECRGSGADRVLVATTGRLDSIEQPNRWSIHRTTFRLGSEGLDVLEREAFDQLVKDVSTPGSEQETSLCGVPFPPNPVFETP